MRIDALVHYVCVSPLSRYAGGPEVRPDIVPGLRGVEHHHALPHPHHASNVWTNPVDDPAGVDSERTQTMRVSTAEREAVLGKSKKIVFGFSLL